MNKFCKHLKQKLNRKFECKKTKKIINISDCINCNNKEYKSNNHQMKKCSSKQAKLEKNRYSVFSNQKDKCYLCPSTTNLTWHEIFGGRNRRNSMKFGLCLRLCINCHERNQENVQFNEFWHTKGQLYFEEHFGSRNDFIKKFGQNYIDDS